MASQSTYEGGKGKEQSDPAWKLEYDFARSPDPSLQESRDYLVDQEQEQEPNHPDRHREGEA